MKTTKQSTASLLNKSNPSRPATVALRSTVCYASSGTCKQQEPFVLCTLGLIGWMPKVAQPKCWHANFFFAKTWAKILTT